MIKKPNKFISLHAHDGFSSYDGMGLPSEHFEWCMQNGLSAHAITNHGHFNSFCHAELWVNDWNKNHKDKPFKFLPGIEVYYHPDLKQWERDKAAEGDKKAAQKELKKQNEKLKTKLETKTDEHDEIVEIETTNALTIENEEDSKTVSRYANPVNRRHHLVLLAKNDKGLQELFHLTSRSFLEGFYRFPRVDTRMMKETLSRGNVVASSACVAGFPSWSIFRSLQEKVEFDDLLPSLLDDPSVMDACVNSVGNVFDVMSDIFGEKNYFLELQFNKLGAQDVANRAILEFARRSNKTDRLIVTCDAHYYHPDVWREREIYKKLGFLNYKDYNPETLPKTKDDLKCELYPKNASQVWEEYQRSRERCGWYAEHDQAIFDAVERSHDVAFDIIGNPKPDKTIKLPKKDLVPSGVEPIDHLSALCIAGMKKRKLKGKRYVDRLKYELDVIGKLNMAEYFITLAKILELAREVVFIGPARGCFVPETRVLMADDMHAPIGTIQVGDCVKDANGNIQCVEDVFKYQINEELLELEFENGRKVQCTKDHKFLTQNRGWIEAQHLTDDDDLVVIV